MGLQNCSKCDALFVAVRSATCPACQKEEEASLDKVSKFLKKNPMAKPSDISEQTGVDEAVILKFVREKKLILAASASSLNCEICGAGIQNGRICAPCQGKLTQSMPGASSPSSSGKTGGILDDGNEPRKRTRSTLILDKFHRR